MLLYWGMFTAGFTIGAVFSFITFAAKKPEEEEGVSPKTFVLIDKRQQPEETTPEFPAIPQAVKES